MNLIWHIRNDENPQAILRRLYEYSVAVEIGKGILPAHRGLYVKPDHAAKAVKVLERDFGRRF